MATPQPIIENEVYDAFRGDDTYRGLANACETAQWIADTMSAGGELASESDLTSTLVTFAQEQSRDYVITARVLASGDSAILARVVYTACIRAILNHSVVFFDDDIIDFVMDAVAAAHRVPHVFEPGKCHLSPAEDTLFRSLIRSRDRYVLASNAAHVFSQIDSALSVDDAALIIVNLIAARGHDMVAVARAMERGPGIARASATQSTRCMDRIASWSTATSF